MATNTIAPQGLLFSRNILTNAPTFQSNIFAIKKGYGTNINIGDLVITLTGANQGYVGLATGAESSMLGVFAGITSLPGNSSVGGASGDGYYDQNIQTYVYGLNGAYVSTANPIGDIGARVISDPFAVFRAQMVGGSWSQSLRGQNINFLAGTNGLTTGNGAYGVSSLSLDFNSVGTDNTKQFRIIGLSGVQGGPQDPTNINPWIEVTLNTSEQLNSLGI